MLAKTLHGKVKLEDAGFDWKILGPDVGNVSRTDQFALGIKTFRGLALYAEGSALAEVLAGAVHGKGQA